MEVVEVVDVVEVSNLV